MVFQSYARENGEHGMYYVSDRSKEILGLDNDPDGYFRGFSPAWNPRTGRQWSPP